MNKSSHRGFIQLPILALIVLGLALAGGAGYVAYEAVKPAQYSVSQKVTASVAEPLLEATATSSEEISTSTPRLSEIEELRLALEEEKTERLKLEEKLTASNQKKTTNVVSSAPPKTNTEIKKEPPKTFTTPSGAVLDENGNVISSPTQPSNISGTEEYSNTQIFNLLSSSIVRIETTEGSGSGFIYDKSGNILTAAHVVEGVNEVEVKVPGEVNIYKGTVVGRNVSNDVAVVNIGQGGFSVAPLGDSNNLEVGEKIVVLGYPLGLGGVVMSTGFLNGKQTINGFTLLQTNASTQPGSSGGAWINSKGKVVGLHLAGMGPQIQGIKINEGFNFAVPINFVKQLLPTLTGQQYTDISTPQTSQNTPTTGATMAIKQSVISAIIYNPQLNCDELGLFGEDINICNLYKYHKDEYKWDVLQGQ